MNIFKRITRWFTCPVEARLEQLTRKQEPKFDLASRLYFCARHPAIELFRDAQREIRHVRIGGWRVIAASESRRIVEVLALTCERIAVRINRRNPERGEWHETTWELYDLEGHLLAMLQAVPGKEFWLSTDFESGHVTLSPLPAGSVSSAEFQLTA